LEKNRERCSAFLLPWRGKKERGYRRIDLFGKKERNYCSLLIAAPWRKEEAQNYVGGLLVQIMAGKRLLVVGEEQKKKTVGCCNLLDQREKH
jgi:hypothetical protein